MAVECGTLSTRSLGSFKSANAVSSWSPHDPMHQIISEQGLQLILDKHAGLEGASLSVDSVEERAVRVEKGMLKRSDHENGLIQ